MKGSTNGAEKNLQRLSILSRFKTPFTPKKPRNVSEYSIELDEPYRTFTPGDRIKGHVALVVERPVRITHLTICLHGVVKVLKNGRISGESINRWRSYLATGQGKWGEAYFGNGLAALFKDEVVLAGDGCLTASSYRFVFDLELPAERLPSSIDFQHGCISYVLSSTLTRPTALRPSNLLPTSRSERIVAVKQAIDIAKLPDPISQVIPLGTIYRKPRRTKIAIASHRSTSSHPARTQHSSIPTNASSAILEASDEALQSPSKSSASCGSTLSSGRNERDGGSEPITRQASMILDGQSTASSDEATVAPTATVEMLQSGCLPGDTVSVKVTINLGRHFRNPEGITLTLYRECHLDIHPAIPLGPWQSGSKQEYEDYYPRSRTGLGGLSLSSGGTSRVFRQDISQKSTALYIDRKTFSATVKASILVPDHLFPTISTVPGRMIDFKYYVEIIIDLRSKSAIQERILPRLSMVNPGLSPNFTPHEANLGSRWGSEREKLAMNSGLLDTSQLRREKGVVTQISEVVVGTRDSRRGRSRRIDCGQDHAELHWSCLRARTDPLYDGTENELHEHGYLSGHDPEDLHDNHVDPDQDFDATNIVFANDVPPPAIENQGDEKTRLRRAEELLLPSAPPVDGEPSSSRHAVQQPSAPVVFDDHDFIQDFNHAESSAPAYERSPRNLHRSHDGMTSSSRGLLANGDEEHSNPDILEDKQELERRRLQAKASAPDAVTTSGAPDLEASAPVLNEDMEEGHMSTSVGQQDHSERLPRYQG